MFTSLKLPTYCRGWLGTTLLFWYSFCAHSGLVGQEAVIESFPSMCGTPFAVLYFILKLILILVGDVPFTQKKYTLK